MLIPNTGDQMRPHATRADAHGESKPQRERVEPVLLPRDKVVLSTQQMERAQLEQKRREMEEKKQREKRRRQENKKHRREIAAYERNSWSVETK